MEGYLQSPVPPKVRMFLWRACVGILPHKAELFRRHIVDSPFCDRCGGAIETAVHALMECSRLAAIWSEASLFPSHIRYFRLHVGGD